MSAAPARFPTTYEDILALPPNETGQIVDEPEIHVGRDVVVPDLAGGPFGLLGRDPAGGDV